MIKGIGGPGRIDAPMDDVQQQILAAKQQMHPGKIDTLGQQFHSRYRDTCNTPQHNA